MQRDKGARGEREVKGLHNAFLVQHGYNVQVKRSQSTQSDGGGTGDLVGLEFLAIEVKWQEVFALNAWWEQTIEQCGANQYPVLFYRRSRVPWRVRMLLDVDELEMVVDISVDDYFRWLETRMIPWSGKTNI